MDCGVVRAGRAAAEGRVLQRLGLRESSLPIGRGTQFEGFLQDSPALVEI